eukprot:scaffold66702_cov62-Phaeocystis_antarctica.AAC.5
MHTTLRTRKPFPYPRVHPPTHSPSPPRRPASYHRWRARALPRPQTRDRRRPRRGGCVSKLAVAAGKRQSVPPRQKCLPAEVPPLSVCLSVCTWGRHRRPRQHAARPHAVTVWVVSVTRL